MDITSNDLCKGDTIRLRNGWEATIEDNLRGNTRLCTVRGFVTEMGSVYSHDIMYRLNPDKTRDMVKHTPAQVKLMARLNSLAF